MCISRAIVWVVPKAEPDLAGPLQQGRPSPSDSHPSCLPGPLNRARDDAVVREGVRSQGDGRSEDVENWREMLQT